MSLVHRPEPQYFERLPESMKHGAAMIRKALDGRERDLATCDRATAARLMALYLTARAMLPAHVRFTGRVVENVYHATLVGAALSDPLAVLSHVEMHEVEVGASAPRVYLYRPVGGRCRPFDLIFAASAFAAVFGLTDAQRTALEAWLRGGHWTTEA